MRVRTKPMKKLMSFVLLLAMIGTMMWPSNSYAADTDEEPAVTDSGAAKETKELEMPYDKTGEPSEDPKETLEDSKISGQTEQKTEQETGQKTESTTEESSGSKSDSKFETTAPVIEKVELAQNQTTVKRDAQISVSVFAYDDSEIADIEVKMAIGDDRYHLSTERCLMGYPEKWSKVEGTNEYVGTYQLDGQTTGKLMITSVKAVDEHGNKTTYNVWDDRISKFWVDIEPVAEESASVESFEFPDNGKSVEKIDDLKKEMSLKLTKAIESTCVWLRFEKEGGGRNYTISLQAVNNSTKNDVFDSSKGVRSNLVSGKYILKDIYITQGIFDAKVSLMMDNMENYGFTITTDSKDTWEDTGKDIEYKVTSVELDKNGQKVQKGDTVNITVSVAADDGVKLPEWGHVDFQAAAPNINVSSIGVSLALDEKDHKYHGSFVVKDMYPCEWYIASIYMGSKTDDSYIEKSNYPCYILVYNGDSFVNPEYNLNVNFRALDENGNYVSVGQYKKENVQRRQTLKEIGVTFPEKNSKYQGLTQVGWTDKSGREITEDTSVLSSYYMEIYAKYDKGFLKEVFSYPASDGKWTTETHIVTYEPGQTYGDFKGDIAFIPDNMTKDYTLTNWERTGYVKDSDVITGVGIGDVSVCFTARFSGVNALKIYKWYYDEKGNHDIDEDYRTSRTCWADFIAVKEGTKVSDMEGILRALELPKMYPGLRFKDWTITPLGMNKVDEAVEDGDSFIMSAHYENYLVRYIISTFAQGKEERTIFCQVAEKGEKIKALTEFEGFGEITWETEAPDKEIDVDPNRVLTFWGRADRISVDPNEPSKPSDTTSGSGNNTDNNTNTTPDSRLPQDVVDSAVKDVNEAEAGETVKISMNSKTVVPKEVLEAAKGKDVSVVLEMEGYSWTINGKDIKATNLQDIDLRVIKNTDNIPSSTVQTLAGDNPCMQITLAHEGNFGFKASLNIGVGSEYTGKYGNLYYHDSAGKMVFMNAGQIGADGNVSLDFSHASDYLLVMSDQAMSQENVPGSLKPTGTSINQSGNGNINIPTTNTGSNVNNANDTGNDSKADDAGNSSEVRRSAKTGDYDTVYLWLLLCAAAMGVMAYTSRKKRI